VQDFVQRPPRIRAGIPVAISFPSSPQGLNRSYPAHVRDLHMLGIGLNHEGLDIEAGEVVCVQFPAEMPDSLSVSGRVAWSDGDGMGVRIQGLGPTANDRYRGLVTSLLATSPVQL
jgi:hypothetical protein